jgi:hypothetical protein
LSVIDAVVVATGGLWRAPSGRSPGLVERTPATGLGAGVESLVTAILLALAWWFATNRFKTLRSNVAARRSR